MSYQTKDDFYAPQESSSGHAPAAYAKDQEYEILEAGLVHNVNDGVSGSASSAAAPWGSNADLEKQLRLGESRVNCRSPVYCMY